MMQDRRGFTLIEVLLAILIGSLVLTSIYGIFGSVSGAKERLEREGQGYHQMRIFFDRIGGELSSLSLTPVGGSRMFSVAPTLEGEPALEFVTGLVSPQLSRKGGISRVRYELRRDGDQATLYRSEQVLLADLAAEEALPFVEGIREFRLRYYTRGSWLEQWSNASPPQMLEISLELAGESGAIPFRSSFVLPEAGG